MSKNDKPPHKQRLTIFIFLLGVIFFPVFARAPELPPEPPTLYFRAISPILTIKPQVMASLASNSDLFAGLTFRTLITCLARYESGFNQNAIGDHGLAIGILQFHQPTFDHYCSGSIYSAEDQLNCCDKMLSEDFNNLSHWTTNKFCFSSSF